MDHRANQCMLGSIVELDDSYFGAKIKSERGRTAGKQSVIICVSKDVKDCHQFLKMTMVPNVQHSALKHYVETAIEKGILFGLTVISAM